MTDVPCAKFVTDGGSTQWLPWWQRWWRKDRRPPSSHSPPSSVQSAAWSFHRRGLFGMIAVSKEFRRPCDVDGTEPPWLVSITSSEALEGRADCTSALFSDLSSWAEALRLANSRDGIACFAAGGAA
ncbi:uncharacterized protein LOC142576252 isoform X1 [Dermacentor variabilis]|uniref:uncharacterized protein LOC142576252 isoform X1 n=1 Tax=Dermacentor variabilis TaxID=34621 RepID=UPI003F5BF002